MRERAPSRWDSAPRPARGRCTGGAELEDLEDQPVDAAHRGGADGGPFESTAGLVADDSSGGGSEKGAGCRAALGVGADRGGALAKGQRRDGGSE